MQFRCLWPFCFFVALKFCDLLSHIHITHSEDPNFSVICGIDGCMAQYTKYNSLHRHISRNHRSWLKRSKISDKESPKDYEASEMNEQLLLPGNINSEHLLTNSTVNIHDNPSIGYHDDGSEISSTSETVPVYNLHKDERPAKPDDFLKCNAAVYCLR